MYSVIKFKFQFAKVDREVRNEQSHVISHWGGLLSQWTFPIIMLIKGHVLRQITIHSDA